MANLEYKPGMRSLRNILYQRLTSFDGAETGVLTETEKKTLAKAVFRIEDMRKWQAGGRRHVKTQLVKLQNIAKTYFLNPIEIQPHQLEEMLEPRQIIFDELGQKRLKALYARVKKSINPAFRGNINLLPTWRLVHQSLCSYHPDMLRVVKKWWNLFQKAPIPEQWVQKRSPHHDTCVVEDCVDIHIVETKQRISEARARNEYSSTRSSASSENTINSAKRPQVIEQLEYVRVFLLIDRMLHPKRSPQECVDSINNQWKDVSVGRPFITCSQLHSSLFTLADQLVNGLLPRHYISFLDNLLEACTVVEFHSKNRVWKCLPKAITQLEPGVTQGGGSIQGVTGQYAALSKAPNHPRNMVELKELQRKKLSLEERITRLFALNPHLSEVADPMSLPPSMYQYQLDCLLRNNKVLSPLLDSSRPRVGLDSSQPDENLINTKKLMHLATSLKFVNMNLRKYQDLCRPPFKQPHIVNLGATGTNTKVPLPVASFDEVDNEDDEEDDDSDEDSDEESDGEYDGMNMKNGGHEAQRNPASATKKALSSSSSSIHTNVDGDAVAHQLYNLKDAIAWQPKFQAETTKSMLGKFLEMIRPTNYVKNSARWKTSIEDQNLTRAPTLPGALQPEWTKFILKPLPKAAMKQLKQKRKYRIESLASFSTSSSSSSSSASSSVSSSSTSASSSSTSASASAELQPCSGTVSPSKQVRITNALLGLAPAPSPSSSSSSLPYFAGKSMSGKQHPGQRGSSPITITADSVISPVKSSRRHVVLNASSATNHISTSPYASLSSSPSKPTSTLYSSPPRTAPPAIARRAIRERFSPLRPFTHLKSRIPHSPIPPASPKSTLSSQSPRANLINQFHSVSPHSLSAFHAAGDKVATTLFRSQKDKALSSRRHAERRSFTGGSLQGQGVGNTEVNLGYMPVIPHPTQSAISRSSSSSSTITENLHVDERLNSFNNTFSHELSSSYHRLRFIDPSRYTVTPPHLSLRERKLKWVKELSSKERIREERARRLFQPDPTENWFTRIDNQTAETQTRYISKDQQTPESEQFDGMNFVPAVAFSLSLVADENDDNSSDRDGQSLDDLVLTSSPPSASTHSSSRKKHHQLWFHDHNNYNIEHKEVLKRFVQAEHLNSRLVSYDKSNDDKDENSSDDVENWSSGEGTSSSSDENSSESDQEGSFTDQITPASQSEFSI